MSKRNKQLTKILGLCLEINPTATRRELTGDKPTVFVQFGGHCNYAQVDIYPTGWSKDATNSYCYQSFDNMRKWVRRENGEETSVTIGVVIADLQRIRQEVQR